MMAQFTEWTIGVRHPSLILEDRTNSFAHLSFDRSVGWSPPFLSS